MKQYKSHKDVPIKYKWDLSFLLQGKSLEQNIKILFKELSKIIKIKDSKYESAKNYLESLKIEDEVAEIAMRISAYFNNSLAINVNDSEILDAKTKFDFEMNEFNQKLGAEEFRFFENAEKIKKWAKLPEFAYYKYGLESRLEEKPHQLSKEVENFRNIASHGDISSHDYFEILNYSEIKFGYATSSKGKKIKITEANRNELMKSNDKMLRKTVAEEVDKAHYKHRESLSNALYQHKKSESTWANILNFPSTIDFFLFDDRIPKDFLLTLYQTTQNNVSINKSFYKYYSKFYEKRFKEKISKYDFARDFSSTKRKFSIEDGNAIVMEALKPFGKDYVDIVKKALVENWVDFAPVDGKDSGAYSIDEALAKQLILMNWDDDFTSLETLVHELGHSVHTRFAFENQGIRNYDYGIFVAEIASIFNELMLHDHMLKTSEDAKFKFEILTQQIKSFNSTVFRSVQFSNFEFDLYENLDKGIPFGGFEDVAKLFHENKKKYAIRPPKKFRPKDNISAVIIPHYYYGFYLYKYAVGHLVANIFFERYKEQGTVALEQFKDFLKLGGSRSNVDILKHVNIDILDPKIWDLGFKNHHDNIQRWISLGKDIWDIK